MSNTFDFKRFGQVLAKDWKNYFRNFGISLIVWCTLPVLLWIATLVLDFQMDTDSRIPFIGIFVFTVLMLVPSKIYGNANLSREGVSFAMLPATSAEQFFSMLLYCSILTPIIVGLGSWAVDSILALLPFGGFVGFVSFPSEKPFLLVVLIACSVMLVSSIFMLGNMVFKKRKAGKTIAWSVLVVFVLTMVLQLVHFWESYDKWVFEICNRFDGAFLVRIYNAFMLIVAIVFYFFTYRKIKTQKY